MKLNIDLLPRPWSGHEPKVNGFEPLIKADIQKVSFSRKTGWRSVVIVGGCPMVTSHHPSKASAENLAAEMLKTYTSIHYKSVKR
jgi:hypothetical protein